MRFTVAGVGTLVAATVLAGGLAPAEATSAPAGQARDTGRFTAAASRSPAPDAPVTVIVELADAPVAVAEAATPDTAAGASRRAARLATLERAQRPVRSKIKDLGGSVLADYQSAYNGLKIRVPRRQLDRIAALPGVTAVHAVRPVRMSGTTGLPFISAPNTWGNGVTGLRGEGVKIAVVDSGIDYTHADFGGPGTQAAYEAAHAGEAAAADPAWFGPSAPKVKGGVDLAGDSYNPDPESPDHQPVPHPDANPLDCNGHGTHVAGVAAGLGVLSDGRTYRGLYSPYTYSGNTWRIAPGVAPKAELYPIRIFGCQGTSELLLDAIEWAVEHDMDVINLSLSTPFGASGPETAAVDNAFKAGVVVVAASGQDDGQEDPRHESFVNQYLTSGPASADGAISVAATDSNSTLSDGSPNDLYRRNPAWLSSVGPRLEDSWLKPDVSAPGVEITSAGIGSGNGAVVMSGSSIATAYVSGLAALVTQAHPDWSAVHVRAAVVNTSLASKVLSRINIPNRAPLVESPLLAGNGLVQTPDAVRTTVTVLGNAGTTAVNFGRRELFQDLSDDRLITLHNHGDEAVTFTSSVTPLGRSEHHRLTTSPTTVQVPAHGSATVVAHLSVTASLAWLSDAVTGVVTFKPAAGQNGGVAVRVPYLAMVDPVSDLATAIDTEALIAAGSATGTVTARLSPSRLPRLDGYVWGVKDADEPANHTNDVRAVGVRRIWSPSSGLPVRYLEFVINFYEFLPRMNVNRYDLFIDADRDGTDDYLLSAVDPGFARTKPKGHPRTTLYNLRTGAPGVVLDYSTQGSEPDNLVIFPLRLDDLADPPVSESSPRFDYRFVVHGLLDGSTDETTTGSYNPWHPALDIGELPVPIPPWGTSGTFQARFDAAEFALTPALGFLIASPSNPSYREAQLIPVQP